MTQEFWIARGKDNTLFLFDNKPFVNVFGLWQDSQTSDLGYKGSLGWEEDNYYPELTFENSPQKVKLTLVKEE